MALTQQDLQAIAQLLKPLEKNIEGLNGRMDGLTERMDRQEARMDSLTERMDRQEARMDSLVERMDRQEEKLDRQEEKLNRQEEKLDMQAEKLNRQAEMIASIENNLTNLKLHVENTTDKGIQLLAENYSNLVQKLCENNKVTEQQSIYQIKVNYLIEDVEKLKEDVAVIKAKIA